MTVFRVHCYPPSAILVETLFASQEPLETVTDMNPYPQAAEAVDGHLSKSIDTLTATTRDGFNRVENQMREMATKDAVNAQVARLDTRVDHAESQAELKFKSVEETMNQGFKTIEERDKARDEAAAKRDEDRDKKFARRMTWTLTGVSLAFGFYTTFIAPFLQHLLK